MPSSTSSSERPVPEVAWAQAVAVLLLATIGGLTAWELYWRSQWFEPAYRNSTGLWTLTRRQLDRPEPPTTAIVGSSRVLFDVNLEAWKRETGHLPAQLALEGTGARPFLAHIAEESDFDGLLLVGVTPPLFFTPGRGLRGDVLDRYRDETPSARIGQRLSMLVEPWLAFYDPDTALFTVLARQEFWPARLDPPPVPEVRKLSTVRVTRQNDMWSRVELDPEYRTMAQETWRAMLTAPRELPPPEEAQRMLEAVFEEVTRHVETIRARGGEVVFVRAPSSGLFREIEAKAFPRERFWDELLRRTGAIGVHFEDHPGLQDVEIPEWSHIRAADTDRFTTELIRILRQEMRARGTMRPELAP